MSFALLFFLCIYGSYILSYKTRKWLHRRRSRSRQCWKQCPFWLAKLLFQNSETGSYYERRVYSLFLCEKLEHLLPKALSYGVEFVIIVLLVVQTCEFRPSFRWVYLHSTNIVESCIHSLNLSVSHFERIFDLETLWSGYVLLSPFMVWLMV